MIVVIDSIARSGTTLLSALLHSQTEMSAYRGVFHEAHACTLGQWPHGLASIAPLPAGQTVRIIPSQTSTSDKLKKLFMRTCGHAVLDWSLLKKHSMQILHKENQSAPIPFDEWEQLLQTSPGSLKELDKLYEKIRLKTEAKILFFRWNQAWSYHACWVARPRHKWITIIRNPMDRACSSLKTHKWTWDESLKTTISYAKRLDTFAKDPDTYILHYEDLVAQPERELQKLFSALGFTPDTINLSKLKGQDGKPYRPEGAANIDITGSHKNGPASNDIYTTAINRYVGEMPTETIELYEKCLSNYAQYKRYF